ncbi:hypothetical protein BDF19DRAFT_71572 [Syncephalis fuscata]|nr:hypothetical protein BDF19DRAFT_71572 [Syncephalis fuscata]
MTEQRWPDSNPPFHVGIIVDTSIDDEKRYRRSLSLLARLESSGKPPEPEELTEFAEALQVVKDTAKRGKIITEDVIPLCVWWLSLDSVALWWLSIFEQEAESLTAVALKKGFIHLQSLITELADTSLSEIAITAIRCAHKLVPHAFLRCCVADDDDGKLWHIVHQVYESVKLRVRSRNPQMQLVAIRFITLFAQIFTQRLTNPRMRRYPHDVSIALYKGGNQGFKTAKCEQYAETILDELLAFICDPGVTYPTGIINCVFIYARSRWKHAVAAIESLLHICKNMPIHWSTMQRRCVRRTILAGFSTLFRYAVSRSDRKTRDFILKAIEEIEETALVKTLILWEEGKRRGHAYPSSNEATTAEMTLNGDSITSKNERIGIGSRSGRVNATGNNRAFGNREPSNLIFVNKRDPRRKDGRFYGRLHVVDPFKQKGKRKKPKDKKATLDEDTLKPSESSNSIAESIPETPRPIIGMSYDHCILFMKSTIDRILYGRLVSLIVPSHLNWRVALDRCAAFLISRGEESDEALALVNNEEDLDIARTHLAQFFASGFNDW